MLVEDQPLHLRASLEHRGRRLGEPKARPDIGHEIDALAEHFRHERRAVRLVDEAQHRIRMRVIDEFRRQERMQQHLDRRVRTHRVNEICALDLQQVAVGDGGAGAQRPQRREANGGKARWLDRRHVESRALHAQRFNLGADEIGHAGFHRSVAAAVAYELCVLAEQPGRVDAQRDVAPDALAGIARDDRRGVALDIAAVHGVAAVLPAKGAQPLLPPMRRAHQPVRRDPTRPDGDAVSAASTSGGSTVWSPFTPRAASACAGSADAGAPSSSGKATASRTVERRRGAAPAEPVGSDVTGAPDGVLASG